MGYIRKFLLNSKINQALSCCSWTLPTRGHTSHLNMLNTAVLPLQTSPVQTSTTIPTASTRTLGVLLIGDGLCFCFVLTQPWEVVLAGQYSLWRTDWLQLTTVLQPQSPQ